MRVMTYNLCWDGIGREEAIARVIVAAAPDVVVVQEMRQQARLARIGALAGMPHNYLPPAAEWWLKVGVLSRRPLLAARGLYFCRRPFGVVARLPLGGSSAVTLFGLHLLSGYP